MYSFFLVQKLRENKRRGAHVLQCYMITTGTMHVWMVRGDHVTTITTLIEGINGGQSV